MSENGGSLRSALWLAGLHDDMTGRRSRHVPARVGLHPRGGRRAAARRRGDGTACGRAGARGSAPVADPHRAGVRQRDHPPDDDRRLDERGRPSARARRPRRRATLARALRRDLAADARAGQRPPLGRAPGGGPPSRRRRPGLAQGARAAAARRGADRHRQRARERLCGRRGARSKRDRLRARAAVPRGRHRRAARLARPGRRSPSSTARNGPPAADSGATWQRLGPPAPLYRRGYGSLYVEHVLQANEGCDFDFLRAVPGEPAETEPLGQLSGWVGGW